MVAELRPVPSSDRLLRRGLRLEYETLAWNTWNIIRTPLMMFTAVEAGSTALAGFGLDSLIEIFASVVVVWQLKGVAESSSTGGCMTRSSRAWSSAHASSPWAIRSIPRCWWDRFVAPQVAVVSKTQIFVIPEEADRGEWQLWVHQRRDHTGAVWTTINVVAQVDYKFVAR